MTYRAFVAEPTGAPSHRRHRMARIATSVVFGLNGLLAAMWVANIPVISARTGVDHAQLGGMLLAAGASAFLAMQLGGPLADRFGSRWLSCVAVIMLALAMIGPVFATGSASLVAALACFGFCNGALDVAMNSQAVVVEQRYRRPIMSSFHAYFSVGGVVGSLIVAATLRADIAPQIAVIVVSVCSIAVVSLLPGKLIGRETARGEISEPDPSHDLAASGAGMTRPRLSRAGIVRVAIMAFMAFALMLAEGTAYDWSGLHMVERYGTSQAQGAIAYGAFSVTMLIGRFRVDNFVTRFGAARVVRAGAAIAILGITAVICAPWAWLSLCGWAVFGLGISAGVPQLFSAAGNVAIGASGRVISIVVGCGYLGMLAGPALIGFVSAQSSLGAALWLSALGAGIAVAAAGVVGTARTSTSPGSDKGSYRNETQLP